MRLGLVEMAKTGRGSTQQMLRLPEDLRERVKAAADGNGRSLNSEIVAALEEKFPEPLPYEIVNVEEGLETVRRRLKAEGPDQTLTDLMNMLLRMKELQDEYRAAHGGKIHSKAQYRLDPNDRDTDE